MKNRWLIILFLQFYTSILVFGIPPVELSNFKVSQKEDSIIIQWKTFSEVNNDYFIIEKSIDAVLFIPLDTVKGAGKSDSIIEYVFYEEFSHSDSLMFYYRLRQVDFNGSLEIFSIVGLYYRPVSVFESIIDTNKMWVVLRNSSIDPPYYNGGDSFAYKFQDSSLIEEVYWTSLWESSDSEYSKWELRGYMKEMDSIVLFMNLTNNIDTLYNFTKKKGEMVASEECELPIDSVTTTNFIGKDRLTMHISDHQYYDVKYYEGIGSNAGLLTPLYNCMVGAYWYLICFYENGELKYHNENFNSCNYNVTSVLNQFERTVNIYPNPIKDRLHIDNVKINTRIEIYNSLGQVVYSKVLESIDNELKIPEMEGFCVVKLFSEEGKIVYSKPMIK